MHKTIDKILALLMAQAGLKQIELARATGVRQFTISRILHPHKQKGIKNPSDKQVKPLADYFKISTDQLRGYEPIPWLAQEPEEEDVPVELTIAPAVNTAAQRDRHTVRNVRRSLHDSTFRQPYESLSLSRPLEQSSPASPLSAGDEIAEILADVREGKAREFMRNLARLIADRRLTPHDIHLLEQFAQRLAEH